MSLQTIRRLPLIKKTMSEMEQKILALILGNKVNL